jgi:hypothetical protein
LHVDSTDVIGQPLVYEVHETLSLRLIEAALRIALVKARENFDELYMRQAVLLGRRAPALLHALFLYAEVSPSVAS